MISNDILVSAIATRLAGDRERVVELFHDNTLHAELAAHPERGGALCFCPQTCDGYYFVASGPGYDVYFQDRGSVQYIHRFADIRAAAAYFFSATAFTSPREGISEGERISNFYEGSMPEARLSLFRKALDALEAIFMAFLGLILGLLAFLVIFRSLQAPNVLAGTFTAAVSAFCFYAGDRARRHRSCFRSK
jgi:hypothetical protein